MELLAMIEFGSVSSPSNRLYLVEESVLRFKGYILSRLRSLNISTELISSSLTTL